MLDALEHMGTAGFPVESVLHIGANEGQERFDYRQAGASPCIYVEPVDSAYAILERNLADLPGHVAVRAVCSGAEGEHVLFNVASNGGQSSSILPLGAHAEHHPSVVYTATQAMVTTTVDRLIAAHSPRRVPNLLVIDAQGADLRVLHGATESLPAMDGVFVEVSEAPLYEGGCTLEDVTGFLRGFGFRLRWMSLDGNGHGNAFYCRPKGAGEPLSNAGNLALGKPAQQSSLCEWSYFLTAKGPGGAVNGAITGFFGFHTAEEDAPWWQVDLQDVHPLREVRIYNRGDSARERARTLKILASDDGAAWRLLHDQDGYTFGGGGRPLRVMLPGAPARHVRLQLAEHTALHLDQVEIY